MAEFAQISPIIQLDADSVNRLVTQLNEQATQVALALAKIQGQDGMTPTFSNNLDLGGKRITNYGDGEGEHELADIAQLRRNALYADREQPHRTSKMIEAAGGLHVPRARAPRDALPLDQAEELLEEILPAGVILLWSGAVADVPPGWAICDGTAGTPDLRDRFIVGAGSTYAVGATGGNATLNLEHLHSADGTLAAASNGAHTHGVGTLANGVPNSTIAVDRNLDALTTNVGTDTHSHTITGATGSDGAHTHDVTGNTANALSSATSILPPYYALAFIMKL